MDGGQDQMSRLGGIERQSHGFGVAHFSDHEHIRVFAQGIEKCLLKTWGVPADFPLANVSAPWPKGVLNRAFNRDDVPGVGQIDFLDERGERGRLAGDRKSTRLNSSHLGISYAVFCLKKKKKNREADI